MDFPGFLADFGRENLLDFPDLFGFSGFVRIFWIFFRDFFRCPPFLTWQRTFTNKLHQVLHIFLVDLRIFEGFLWIFEGFLWICEGFLWIFEGLFLWFLRIFWILMDFNGF